MPTWLPLNLSASLWLMFCRTKSKLTWTIAFFLRKKKAILVGNTAYKRRGTEGFDPLGSPEKDVLQVESFLTNYCKFEPTAIDRRFNPSRDDLVTVFQQAREWARDLTMKDPDHPERGLVFIYYSGHGIIDKKGHTCIVCTDERPFSAVLAATCKDKKRLCN